jgi:hypothetical protein
MLYTYNNISNIFENASDEEIDKMYTLPTIREMYHHTHYTNPPKDYDKVILIRCIRILINNKKFDDGESILISGGKASPCSEYLKGICKETGEPCDTCQTNSMQF